MIGKKSDFHFHGQSSYLVGPKDRYLKTIRSYHILKCYLNLGSRPKYKNVSGIYFESEQLNLPSFYLPCKILMGNEIVSVQRFLWLFASGY